MKEKSMTNEREKHDKWKRKAWQIKEKSMTNEREKYEEWKRKAWRMRKASETKANSMKTQITSANEANL